MSEAIQYVVKEGERWDTIAHKAYGNATLVKAIIEANPLVPITPRLPAGTVLSVPVIDQVNILTDVEKLPPWKK
jgi:phage tail protein X